MSCWIGGEMSGRNSAYDIEWDTSLGGLTAAPSNSTKSGGSSFMIDWGDGSPIEWVTTENTASHTYSSHGVYRIRAWGQSQTIQEPTYHWQVYRWSSKAGVTQLINFGRTRSVGAGYNSYYGHCKSCSNLKTTYLQEGPPPTTNGNNSFNSFFKSTSIGVGGEYNPNVWKSWNISESTDLSSFFDQHAVNRPNFNPDTSGWDVSKVIYFHEMFQRITNFDRDLSRWNMSSLTGEGISYMFAYVSSFNNGGATGIADWDVSRCTSMRYVFGGNQFNQPIGSWDVSNVTVFQQMFANADVFNQDIGSWDVSSSTTMGSMFTGAASFNQDISSWNPGTVSADFANMLNNCGMSTANYSKWLIALANWAYDNSYSTAESLGAATLTYHNTTYTGIGSGQYTDAVSAKNYLTTTLGWTITDGGQV